MPDYSANAATALRMLTNYGQSVTRRTYSAGTYDPATGSTTPTTADTTRKGAAFDYSAMSVAGQQFVRGTLIESGDKKLYLDTQGAAEVTDHYIVNGKEYTVVSVGEINPAGIPVLFDLHLRLS